MKAAIVMRFAILAFITLVACMKDQVDESDSIFQKINEEFSPNEEDVLMNLFSMDEQMNDDQMTANVEGSEPQEATDIAAIDTDINTIGMQSL